MSVLVAFLAIEASVFDSVANTCYEPTFTAWQLRNDVLKSFDLFLNHIKLLELFC